MTTELNPSDIPNLLTELETAFYDIPFENSDFQNSIFVVAAQQTPGRAYRAIGLRMFAKIRAIKELNFARRLEEIDLEEKQELVANEQASRFERMRAQVEIDKMLDQRAWTDKLLNDALKELGCLYAEFKKLPAITRDQFEEEERLHFQMRLERQAQGQTGALESLANMNGDATLLDHLATDPLLLQNLKRKVEESLTTNVAQLEASLNINTTQ